MFAAVLFSITAELSSAANMKSHYDYTVEETTLKGDYEVYTGVGPATVLIEGDGSTIINGAGHHGYQFIELTQQTTITVKNIAAFKGFVDTTDKSAASAEGGSAFYIGKNATLNFTGYSKDYRLTFNGNSVQSDGHNADAAAISIQAGGIVGDIYADFSNNNCTYPDDLTTVSGLTYARGAAINVSGSVAGGTVGNVYGTFTNNSAEYGGAIYVGTDATIGTIEGRFESNHAAASYKPGGYTGGSAGGAIRFFKGQMSSINAEFVSNTVRGLSNNASSTAQGGAIALYGATFKDDKGSVQGKFLNNISFSDYAIGYGGAFYLIEQDIDAPLYITDATITGNMAGTGNVNSEAFGGAFYVKLSDHVYIEARNNDVLMRDNYELVGGTWKTASNTVTGGVRDYNAIYAEDSIITLRAKDSTEIINGEEVTTGHKITIDDSIESKSDSALILDSTSSQRYDVEINAEIRNMDVTVQQGGLILGSYEHIYTENSVTYKDTTHGGFDGGTLTITAGGLVNSKADNISTAHSITNAGLIEFTGGTLSQNINTTGQLNGDLAIMGDTSVSSNQQVYADTIIVDDFLRVAHTVTVDAKTLLYQGANKDDINGAEQIVLSPETSLDFDVVRLEIGSAVFEDYFDLIISDGTGNVNASFNQDYSVEFTLGGVLLTRDVHYVVQEPDSNGGLRILFIAPEPSTTSLSLLALSALLLRRRRQR